MVDSDDGMKDEELEESGNETDDDDYDELQDEGDAEYIIGIEQEPANRLKADDEYTFEVLTAGEVVGLIQEIIRDVNTVVQIPATVTRILLNHFKWDKEKLMECYYDGDQERLFSEAHVVSPFRPIPESARAAQAFWRKKCEAFAVNSVHGCGP